MTAVLSILIILTGIVWYILNVDKARSQRRTEIMSRPFPDKWKTIIEKSGPLTKKLPESLKKDLYRKVQVFIEEISFEGCKGFEITETVKVSVAAQACILLLNRPNSFYNKLKTILIYPDTYVAKNASIAGMHTEPNEIPVAGQSYDSGTVILAWRHVTRGAGNRKDGNNVVFHEFAHQLDQEDGSTDGMPVMRERSQLTPWITNVGKEYTAFAKRITKGRKDVMDSYGSTNTAEFFAVATETFFEKPYQLYRKHPLLFKKMQDYFKVDPRKWV